jgi:hypothetical protein
MQNVGRQDYPVWDLAPTGRTIHDAVALAAHLLTNPTLARRYTDEEQDLSFTAESGYFAWIEIYAARHPDARLHEVVASHRPVWSPSSVGAATLYFLQPQRRRAASLANR